MMNNSTTTPVDLRPPRICNLCQWDDFNGYGFNLHAEKGRPGQYVGKVDENSPAEFGGMETGMRLVEVNGVNIINENHKQVVERIRMTGRTVQLLVVDRRTDAWCREHDIVIQQSMPEFFPDIQSYHTPSRPPSVANERTSIESEEMDKPTSIGVVKVMNDESYDDSTQHVMNDHHESDSTSSRDHSSTHESPQPIRNGEVVIPIGYDDSSDSIHERDVIQVDHDHRVIIRTGVPDSPVHARTPSPPTSSAHSVDEDNGFKTADLAEQLVVIATTEESLKTTRDENRNERTNISSMEPQRISPTHQNGKVEMYIGDQQPTPTPPSKLSTGAGAEDPLGLKGVSAKEMRELLKSRKKADIRQQQISMKEKYRQVMDL